MARKKQGAKKQLIKIIWHYSPLKIVRNNGR
jgi:hypothetical protein